MGRFLFYVEASSPGLVLKLLRKIHFLVAGVVKLVRKSLEVAGSNPA